MDKEHWLSLSAVEKAGHIKILLSRVVTLTNEARVARANKIKKSNSERFTLEKEIAKLFAWEKENNEIE